MEFNFDVVSAMTVVACPYNDFENKDPMTTTKIIMIFLDDLEISTAFLDTIKSTLPKTPITTTNKMAIDIISSST